MGQDPTHEQSCALPLILVPFCAVVGLFLCDVFLDIFNLVNLTQEGKSIWGFLIIGIVFLPDLAFLVWLLRALLSYDATCIFQEQGDDSSQRTRIWVLQAM